MADPQFPEGKINEDDEGALGMQIFPDVEKNVVVIQFPKPVNWFALEPQYVDEFIKLLESNKQRVLSARGQKRGT